MKRDVQVPERVYQNAVLDINGKLLGLPTPWRRKIGGGYSMIYPALDLEQAQVLVGQLIRSGEHLRSIHHKGSFDCLITAGRIQRMVRQGRWGTPPPT